MKKAKEDIAIFWFRRDLRLNDNAGLFHALNSGLKVIPIFIFDRGILERLSSRCDARVNFIHAQVERINLELKKYNSTLLTFHKHPQQCFEEIIDCYNVKAVYTNNDYEPLAISRDNKISNFLAEKGIGFHSYKDQVIFEKKEIVKADDSPYTVFTPYKNRWLTVFNSSNCHTFETEKSFYNLYKLEFAPVLSLSDIGFEVSNIKFPESVPNEDIIIWVFISGLELSVLGLW